MHVAGTHCVEPPAATPVEQTQLERNWDGNFVNFDATIDYTCIRGQKVKDDFSLTVQRATCRDGNVWETPTAGWKDCVESEIQFYVPTRGNGSINLRRRQLYMFGGEIGRE